MEVKEIFEKDYLNNLLKIDNLFEIRLMNIPSSIYVLINEKVIVIFIGQRDFIETIRKEKMKNSSSYDDYYIYKDNKIVITKEMELKYEDGKEPRNINDNEKLIVFGILDILKQSSKVFKNLNKLDKRREHYLIEDKNGLKISKIEHIKDDRYFVIKNEELIEDIKNLNKTIGILEIDLFYLDYVEENKHPLIFVVTELRSNKIIQIEIIEKEVESYILTYIVTLLKKVGIIEEIIYRNEDIKYILKNICDIANIKLTYKDSLLNTNNIKMKLSKEE